MASGTALAREAVLYAWPLYEMRRMRASASFSRIEGVGDTGDEDLRWSNVFWHRRRLIRPGDTPIVTPNTDTLYSTAWLDLAAGALVIDVPDTAGRYYVLGFLDFYTNPFAHIGQRLTGTQASSFLVTGPGWEGEVPPEFLRPYGQVKCATRWVRVIARIMVDERDVAAAHRVQDGLRIRSFDGAPAPSTFRPECDHRLPPVAAHFAAQVSAALGDAPPPEEERDMVARFADVGLGAELVADADQLAVLQAAIDNVLAELRAPAKEASRGGWEFLPEIRNTYGRDYGLRAQVALRYLGMLETREAIYPMAWFDGDGNSLNGQKRYVLRFAKGQLPPADAFWSLTMYSAETMNLVENAIDRYAIGDRTPGLQPDEDGGLTIRIQHDPPKSPAHAANWLPAPAGAFYLCLRAYLPRPELLDASYRLPPVRVIRG